jgi:hypothetical protein
MINQIIPTSDPKISYKRVNGGWVRVVTEDYTKDQKKNGEILNNAMNRASRNLNRGR